MSSTVVIDGTTVLVVGFAGSDSMEDMVTVWCGRSSPCSGRFEFVRPRRRLKSGFRCCLGRSSRSQALICM
jgi:hypothetical protein